MTCRAWLPTFPFLIASTGKSEKTESTSPTRRKCPSEKCTSRSARHCRRPPDMSAGSSRPWTFPSHSQCAIRPAPEVCQLSKLEIEQSTMLCQRTELMLSARAGFRLARECRWSSCHRCEAGSAKNPALCLTKQCGHRFCTCRQSYKK